MQTLTITEASERTGVTRRTLQRAIKAGRLPLLAGHRVSLEDLAQAGYPVIVAATRPSDNPSMSQRHDAATSPVACPSDVPVTAHEPPGIAALLQSLLTLMEEIHRQIVPRDTSQRQAREVAATRRSDTGMQDMRQASDEVWEGRYLGDLCKREHRWRGAEQSLRQVSNNSCLGCNIERARTRRQHRAKTD